MKELKTRSFVLKLWQEELLENKIGFRGEVRDPISRKTKYFSSWPELQAILADHLALGGRQGTVQNTKHNF